ncbi:unnamed protein product [Mytilus edulis]|uniref:G-protein coupled receptors family 1 profile domain-containing protein n=1 Tax=Mytilus edulis TaxID=6550 RepID=A0A8S3VDG5_MYTED|nr:unnamed protein product [Mytilus edulis]
MLSNISNQSYDLNCECNYGNDYICEQSELFIPSAWITITQPCLTVECAVVNIFIITILLRPKNRTPSTILLSSLAASDCLTTILAPIPYLIGYTFNFNNLIIAENSILGGWIWPQLYSNCIILTPLSLTSSGFHMMSVCFTFMLNIQKVIALQFPLWTMKYIGNKATFLAICPFVLIVLGFNTWRTITGNGHFFEGKNGVCCIVKYKSHINGSLLFMNMCLMIITLVIILCTIYICWKLRTLGKNIQIPNVRKNSKKIPNVGENSLTTPNTRVNTPKIPNAEKNSPKTPSVRENSRTIPNAKRNSMKIQNPKAQAKIRRSAFIVIFISVVFILSEVLNYLWTINQSGLLPFSHSLDQLCDSLMILSWQFGFSVNFIVYFIMSAKLRKTLQAFLVKIFRCNKRKKDENIFSNTITSTPNSAII